MTEHKPISSFSFGYDQVLSVLELHGFTKGSLVDTRLQYFFTVEDDEAGIYKRNFSSTIIEEPLFLYNMCEGNTIDPENMNYKTHTFFKFLYRGTKYMVPVKIDDLLPCVKTRRTGNYKYKESLEYQHKRNCEPWDRNWSRPFLWLCTEPMGK